jgi:hypothetical protein
VALMSQSGHAAFGASWSGIVGKFLPGSETSIAWFRQKFLHDLALFAQAPMLRSPGRFNLRSGSACRLSINWSLLDAPCCPVPQPQ